MLLCNPILSAFPPICLNARCERTLRPRAYFHVVQMRREIIHGCKYFIQRGFQRLLNQKLNLLQRAEHYTSVFTFLSTLILFHLTGLSGEAIQVLLVRSCKQLALALRHVLLHRLPSIFCSGDTSFSRFGAFLPGCVFIFSSSSFGVISSFLVSSFRRWSFFSICTASKRFISDFSAASKAIPWADRSSTPSSMAVATSAGRGPELRLVPFAPTAGTYDNRSWHLSFCCCKRSLSFYKKIKPQMWL